MNSSNESATAEPTYDPGRSFDPTYIPSQKLTSLLFFLQSLLNLNIDIIF